MRESTAAFPELARAAHAGRWMFVALLAFGILLTAALFSRSLHKSVLPQAQLTYRMRGATLTEYRLYMEYFTALELSPLRARAVRRGDRAVDIKVGADLSGKDDPRVLEIMKGLEPVREEAMRRLQKERIARTAELRVLEAFIANPTDDLRDQATIAAVEDRMVALRSLTASLDERLAKRELPVLDAIRGSDPQRKHLVEILASLFAAFFTAVAGGLIFGYGRLLAKR